MSIPTLPFLDRDDWQSQRRKKLVEVVKSQQLIETAAEREALFTLKSRKRRRGDETLE